jgi:hypothetical protein
MPYAVAHGGTNEYITMGDAVPLRFERTNPFSIVLWARWTANAVMILAGKMGDLNANRGYDVHTLTGGRWGINLNNDFVGGNWLGLRGQTVVNDGTWHHLAFCYGGGSNAASCDLYTDGALEQKTVFNDALSATILTPASFLVGARLEPGIALPLTGDWDELGVFSKKLSGTEVDNTRKFGVGKVSNLVGYWTGDGGIHPTIPDGSINSNNGTMTNMEADDIFARSQFVGSTAGPVVTNIVPNPGTTLTRSSPVQFDVLDDVGFAAVLVYVSFPGRATELVHDSLNFRFPYAASTRISISGGFRYVVRRTGGWPGDPTFVAHAIDSEGNQNA